MQGFGQQDGVGTEMDPQVFYLMAHLDRLRRMSLAPLSVDEQSETLGRLTEQQELHGRASQSQSQIMAAGDAQFDDATMEGAVRAAKRQRSLSSKAADLGDARKIYACGPEEQRENPHAAAADEHDLDGLALDTNLLGLSPDFVGEHSGKIHNLSLRPSLLHEIKVGRGCDCTPDFSLLDSICSNIWLAAEVGKHMTVGDIVKLYSVSKSFHSLINRHWQSTIIAWAETMAPSSLRIFYWKLYAKYTIQDPMGTTWAAPGPFMADFPRPVWAVHKLSKANDERIRSVPSLRYLAMIVEREVRVRDILAVLARNGHRLPRTAHETLKKIWLLMDMATNDLRRAFVRNEQLWRAQDLYNAQMFFIKLQMRFNEPVFGPSSPILAETLLGSKQGLTPLWQMLRGKGFTDLLQVVQMRVRYMCDDDMADDAAAHWDHVFGVPPEEVGVGHLEGWGAGTRHLSRPDELVIEEAVHRGINLSEHLMFMIFWGHVSWKKHVNLVPSEEEMYMSDDELEPIRGGIPGRCGNVPFEYGNWLPKHALKARWDTLTEAEKKAVNDEDEDEAMKTMPHLDNEDGFWDLDDEELKYVSCSWEKTECPNEREEHDEDCVCDECYDSDDYQTNEDDNLDDAGASAGNGAGDVEVVNSAPQKTILPFPTLVPIPQDALTDSGLVEVWHQLDHEHQQQIIEAHNLRRLHEGSCDSAEGPTREEKKVGWEAVAREFPGITDPVSLVLLRKLDKAVVPSVIPGETITVENADEGSSDMEEADAGKKNDVYNAGGREDVDGGAETEMETGTDSETDDEALKALADDDYSETEFNFDVKDCKAFLSMAGDGGGIDADLDLGLEDNSRADIPMAVTEAFAL